MPRCDICNSTEFHDTFKIEMELPTQPIAYWVYDTHNDKCYCSRCDEQGNWEPIAEENFDEDIE
jgi:hypothetical protein